MDRTNFNTLLKSFSMEENFIKFGCFWKHILIFFANLSENIWQNCVLSQTCHFLLGYIRDVLEVCRLMRRMEGHSSLTHISQGVMYSGALEIVTREEKRLDYKIHSWRQIQPFAKYKVQKHSEHFCSRASPAWVMSRQVAGSALRPSANLGMVSLRLLKPKSLIWPFRSLV